MCFCKNIKNRTIIFFRIYFPPNSRSAAPLRPLSGSLGDLLLQRVPQVFHFSTDFGAFPSYVGSKRNMFDKKLSWLAHFIVLCWCKRRVSFKKVERAGAQKTSRKQRKRNHKSEESPLKYSALALWGPCWSRSARALRLTKLAPRHPGPSTSSPTRLKAVVTWTSKAS